MIRSRAAISRRRWLVAIGAGIAVPGVAQSMRRPWPAGRATPPLALALAPARDAAWDAASVKGHPLLVNFWATWCGPCREEMQSLQAAASRHADAGLRVIAVNFRDPEPAIGRFMAETSLTLPVLRDADGTVAKAFGVNVFPSTVAIGRDGRARFTIVGEHDWTDGEAQRWIVEILGRR